MALLVKYREVKVNYTRKVVHISYFVWPQLLDKYFLPYQTSTYIELWNIWIIITLLVIYSFSNTSMLVVIASGSLSVPG